MSARNLAGALGRKVTTIYHHLKLLENVGLIEPVSAEASKGGRPYVVYRSIAPRVRLTRAAIDPKLRAPMAKWARIVGREAAREFVAGMAHPQARVEGSGRNLWMARMVIAPSPERLARINQLLDELSEFAWTPEPEPGELLSVGWFVNP